MTINNIIKNVNASLAGEMLSYSQLVLFLDKAIDDINTRLNTAFPVFSELPEDATEYTAIPDKYIRSVVIPGAAYYFYTMDEEGAPVASEYFRQYENNLFYMTRDYLMLIPDEYLADPAQGTFVFEAEKETGPKGMMMYGYSNYI